MICFRGKSHENLYKIIDAINGRIQMLKQLLFLFLLSFLFNCAVARVTDPKPQEKGKSGEIAAIFSF